MLTQYIYVFRITHNELLLFLKIVVCVLMQCEALVARTLVLNFPVYKNSEFCGIAFLPRISMSRVQILARRFLSFPSVAAGKSRDIISHSTTVGEYDPLWRQRKKILENMWLTFWRRNYFFNFCTLCI